jgi:hypothetical protein
VLENFVGDFDEDKLKAYTVESAAVPDGRAGNS